MRLLQLLRAAVPLIIVNLFGWMYFLTESDWWILIPVFIVLFDFFVMDWRIFNRVLRYDKPAPKLKLNTEEVNLFTDIFER